MDPILYTQGMTDSQRLLFMSEFNNVRKSRGVAFVLTLFLGGIGAHRFYLGEMFWGVIYLVLFWTFIPAIVAFIELFLIMGRVDRYNEKKALETAAKVKLLSAAPATV